MNTRDQRHELVAGQLDLFNATDPPPPSTNGTGLPRVPRIESNNAELMHTIAANALHAGYLLVGQRERVYARHDDAHAVRIPRWEQDAVHQLLARRWLTRGNGTAHVACGRASLTGTPVLVPKTTRTAVARWQHLQRPPTWPDTSRAQRSATSEVADFDTRRRNR